METEESRPAGILRPGRALKVLNSVCLPRACDAKSAKTSNYTSHAKRVGRRSAKVRKSTSAHYVYRCGILRPSRFELAAQ